MINERNARIAAFQKVSGYLFWLYWPIVFVLAFFIIAILVTAVITKNGDTSLIEFLIKLSAPNIDFFDIYFDVYFNTGVSLPAKLISSITMLIFMTIGIYMLFHFTRTLECFNAGNIFSRITVFHARKAYKLNLLVGFLAYGIELLVVVLSFIYADSDNGYRVRELLHNLFNFLVEIGILSLILWALEMGTDLNEESELTI